MRRFMLISLGIGGLVAFIVLVLYYFGVFEPLVTRLNDFLVSRDVYPDGAMTKRLTWVEWIAVPLVAVWTCWSLSGMPQFAQKLIVVFIFTLIIAAAVPALALYGWLFDPFSSIASLYFGAIAAIGLLHTELGKRKRLLETVLERRVSQQTFDELLTQKTPPSFEGKSREVTVLTCRLFNRAELAEHLKPADFIRMTNLFRRVMSSFLALKGAYLDEAGPELIRAYFGLLRDEENHSELAARAALDLRTRLQTLNKECRSQWNEELQAGVGLDSGTVVSGIYGSKEQFFLSGIGAPVDFSRRLSKANLRYGTDLLLGPEMYRLIRDTMEVRPMEMFYDPETDALKEIYQLLATKESFGEEDRKLRDYYWDGVINFRAGNYAEAIENFSKARIPGKNDPPLEFFIEQTQFKIRPSAEGEASVDERPGEGHSRLLGQM